MMFLSDLETGAGLDIVLGLQAGRSPLLDGLAWALHIAGSEVFLLVLLSLIVLFANRRLGVRLIFALVIGELLAYALKEVLQRPRPFMVSEAVVPLFSQGSYGLPSGHVTASVAVWGYFAFYYGRRWLYGVIAVYLLVLGWARMYAGVHYPQDVVLGLIVGLFVVWLLARYADPAANWWRGRNNRLRAGVTLLVVALLALLWMVYSLR